MEQFVEPERIVSKVEKDFFTKGFIEERNPYVIRRKEISERSPGVLDSVYNELKRENDEHNFIPHFVELFGFPSWQNAFIMEYSSHTEAQIAIPFFHEYDTLITGFLYSRVIQGTVELGDFFIYEETAEVIEDTPLASTWEKHTASIVLSSILNEIVFNNFHLSDAFHEWVLEAIDTYQLTDENDPAVQIRSGFYWCFWTCTAWTTSQGQSDATGWYWIDKDLASGSPVPVTVNNRCLQWAYICIYWDLEPPDWDRFTNMNTGGGSGAPNPPAVNLGPHLIRIENCGGLGDSYDYGPSNPSGQHPDRIFCEQLQSLYDCLPFLAADDELIAWYLWYDATYQGDTWGDLYNFGCGSHMSSVLKEKGIRLWKELYPFDFQSSIDTWVEFEALWAIIANIENDNEISLTETEEEWLVVTNVENGILSELSQLLDIYSPYILTEDFQHLQNATSILLRRSMNPITISEEQAYEDVVGGTIPIPWGAAIQAEYFALKLEHCLHTYNPSTGLVTFSNCDWSETRLQWTARLNVLLEGFHSLLQTVGLAPGIGEIADLTDGIIYSIQGDGFNAALSFSSTLPIAGYGATAVRFAMRTITGPSGRTITFKFLRETANSLVTFGDRGQLRRVLGLAKGNPLVAHHLIPWGQSSQVIVQKAAKSTDVTLSNGTVLKTWHMNDALNGIPLDYTLHTGNHTTYSNTVRDYLNDLADANPNISNEQALTELKTLATYIRDWITNNPGVHIDNIILP